MEEKVERVAGGLMKEKEVERESREKFSTERKSIFRPFGEKGTERELVWLAMGGGSGGMVVVLMVE